MMQLCFWLTLFAVANSLDATKIRDALAETKGFQGATGTITFDEQGDPLNKPMVIMKLGKDAPIYFKTNHHETIMN